MLASRSVAAGILGSGLAATVLASSSVSAQPWQPTPEQKATAIGAAVNEVWEFSAPTPGVDQMSSGKIAERRRRAVVEPAAGSVWPRTVGRVDIKWTTRERAGQEALGGYVNGDSRRVLVARVEGAFRTAITAPPGQSGSAQGDVVIFTIDPASGEILDFAIGTAGQLPDLTDALSLYVRGGA